VTAFLRLLLGLALLAQTSVLLGSQRRGRTGRSNSPFRFWLAEAETRWRRSGFYLPELPGLDGLDGAGDDEPLLPPGLRSQDREET
jgi:hypothetical protein